MIPYIFVRFIRKTLSRGGGVSRRVSRRGPMLIHHGKLAPGLPILTLETLWHAPEFRPVQARSPHWHLPRRTVCQILPGIWRGVLDLGMLEPPFCQLCHSEIRKRKIKYFNFLCLKVTHEHWQVPCKKPVSNFYLYWDIDNKLGWLNQLVLELRKNF